MFFGQPLFAKTPYWPKNGPVLVTAPRPSIDPPNRTVRDIEMDLHVQLGRLTLKNPVMVASGTFGYAREMAGLVDLARLARHCAQDHHPGSGVREILRLAPWKPQPDCSIRSGLDNDGLEAFLTNQFPFLASLETAIVVSVAGKSHDDFVYLAERLATVKGIAALELNVSCPNVSGGVDFGTDPEQCEKVVRGVRGACDWPIVAKLTPNVTSVPAIAQAAATGGADAVALINTCLGMAVDWRGRRPRLGNVMGGLSGPAIKPIALRIIHQVRQAVDIPIIGIGGIASVDDCMEFLVTGASAVQIGTASFYRPSATMEILDGLPAALGELGAERVADVIGTLKFPPR